MTDIPMIETERLTLRAPKAEDLPKLTAFYATERSHIVGGPRDVDQCFTALTSRIGLWAVKGFGLWHLDHKGTGAFAGWTGMLDAPAWDEPELGWTVFEEFEGQGLAFEAAHAARRFVQEVIGLPPMISYIAHTNDRSQALARRLGAAYEREGEVIGKPCQVWRHPEERP